MAFSPRVVLIPLAASGGAGGRLARAQADGSAPGRNEAGLNPRIAELADWHLYEAGAIALGAVRRLNLPHRRLALFQRLRPATAYPYLSVTNGPDIIGLQPENTQSAELGLALGVLMYAGQSSAEQVIATGCLDRQAWSGSGRQDDVRVLPVSEIGKKIVALRDSLASQKGAALATQVQFFLPATTIDGADTLAEHRQALDDLAAAFKRKDIELEVCPVESLRDAASTLGIGFYEVTTADRVASAALAAAACLIVVALGAAAWLNAPIQLAYGAVATANGERVPTPLRAVFDSTRAKYVLEGTCIGAQGLPTFQVDDSLVLDVQATDRYRAFGAWPDHRFVVVAVSERSGVKVFPPETIGAVNDRETGGEDSSPDIRQSGKLLSIQIPVGPPAEENKVIILARRLLGFDADDLLDELEEVIADKPPSARINAVVSHLAGRAPGYLDYSFMSAEGELPCAEES
jgi:hypothetical protein